MVMMSALALYSLLGCDIYQWMSPCCKVVCFLASSVNKAKVAIIPKTRKNKQTAHTFVVEKHFSVVRQHFLNCLSRCPSTKFLSVKTFLWSALVLLKVLSLELYSNKSRFSLCHNMSPNHQLRHHHTQFVEIMTRNVTYTGDYAIEEVETHWLGLVKNTNWHCAQATSWKLV